MMIKAIFIGNVNEAYTFEDFQEGLNIVSSDDNNKGKTIVTQSILYCMGNIPTFPTSFLYEDYYHILHIEDDGKLIKICRKAKNFVIQNGEEYAVFDNTSEFKRYWNKNIQKLPVIKKNNVWRIVDPELLVQLFFVGQDKKTTSDIINKGWYKKGDFYALLYSMVGIDDNKNIIRDVESAKKKIKDFKYEKETLLKENKILKNQNITFEYLSATNDKIAFENMLKEVEKIKNKLLELKKERANAVSRRTKNELALKELRSLNRTMKTGRIACLDCGSNHIAYESSDSEFSFDISTATMRRQILNSVQEKIDIYNEEIDRLTNEIMVYQKELDSTLGVDDIQLEALLVVRREMEGAREADERIIEIDHELEKLSEELTKKEAVSDDTETKSKKLLEDIVNKMNKFYKSIDSTSDIVYNDIFTTRDKVYSGSEATEFHLARMYAFAKVLKHRYPIIIDSFRAEDLSTEREKRAINKISELENQLIFTTTLKDEEENKYIDNKSIHNIDFSSHTTNKILSNKHVNRFLEVANEMMISIK